jgi:SAM-dependent methyltransferase
VSAPPPPGGTALRDFAEAYAEHRSSEGRGAGGQAELLALPWLRRGPLAAQWGVRARTFRRFIRAVVEPHARRVAPARLRVLDAGAGNGWLCRRLAMLGHAPTALDLRTDAVDGLGAAMGYAATLPRLFPRVAASFDALPLGDGAFDLVVFNASLHYAVELERVLAEAVRVLAPGGAVTLLDSPFYRTRAAGDAMVAEKRAGSQALFGGRARALMALPSVEYLTRDRLVEASRTAGLAWRRLRVRYPLWYELRPLKAALARRRPPSRFDLWVSSTVETLR